MSRADLGVPDPDTVADRLAIEDVLYAYADAIDGRDWEAVREVFTDDAVLDYAGSGGPAGPRDEVVDWIRAMLSNLGHSQHAMLNPRIRVEGDRAHAVCQLVNPLLMQAGPEETDALLVGGRYVDRLRRVDGAWRIEHRVQAMDWQAVVRATAMAGAEVARPAPGADL